MTYLSDDLGETAQPIDVNGVVRRSVFKTIVKPDRMHSSLGRDYEGDYVLFEGQNAATIGLSAFREDHYRTLCHIAGDLLQICDHTCIAPRELDSHCKEWQL